MSTKTILCKRDGFPMVEGIAFFHVKLSEMTDYGVVSYPQHPQAPLLLIKCLKCPKCGRSITI